MCYGACVPESPLVSFRIPPWLLALLDQMAEEERRTRGSMIRLLLERQLSGESEAKANGR